MWNERMLLVDVEIPDSDCWMVLTPDMDVYAENLGENAGVKRTGTGNSVPATIPRGQAYRFDPAFPGLNEFEAYTELAEDLVDEERERMLEEYPDLAPDAPDPPGRGHVPGGALPPAGGGEETVHTPTPGGAGAPGPVLIEPGERLVLPSPSAQAIILKFRVLNVELRIIILVLILYF